MTTARVGTILGNYNASYVTSTNWEIHTTGRLRVYWRLGEIDVYGTSNVADGNYHRIVWVRHKIDNKFYLYIDGKPETMTGTNTAGTDISPFECLHKIGADQTAGHALYTGLISDDMIYNRALSAEEVSYLFAYPYCMFDEPVYPAWMLSAVSAQRYYLQLLAGGV